MVAFKEYTYNSGNPIWLIFGVQFRDHSKNTKFPKMVNVDLKVVSFQPSLNQHQISHVLSPITYIKLY